MPDQDDSDLLSPKDMRGWVQQEIKDSAKAHELRTKELEALASAYESGKLTPAQADEQKERYEHRWGEALRGTFAFDNISDEQILAKIDATRKPFRTRGEISESYRRKHGNYPGDDGQSR
jgi:hypothetical protein